MPVHKFMRRTACRFVHLGNSRDKLFFFWFIIVSFYQQINYRLLWYLFTQEIIFYAFLRTYNTPNLDANDLIYNFWQDIVLTSLDSTIWYSVHPWVLTEVAHHFDPFGGKLLGRIFSVYNEKRREMQILISYMMNRGEVLKSQVQRKLQELQQTGQNLDSWLNEIAIV